MKFKTWLKTIEEANQRSRQPVGNPDQTTGLGPTSHFGGPRAMLPISPGIDNRAFAGVMDGIGSARAKIRARMGAEPGVASQYSPLEDIRRDGLQTAHMPLQLPEEWDGQPISIGKGLIAQIKYSFGDALENNNLWRVDDQMNLIEPEVKSTKLYTSRRLRNESPAELEAAINYTTALMQVSFMVKLSKYAHLLNLDRPNLHNRSIAVFPLQEKHSAEPYGPNDNPEFYKVMLCAFVFKPKNKDIDVGDDIHSQIDKIISNKEEEQAAEKPRPRQDARTGLVSGGDK